MRLAVVVALSMLIGGLVVGENMRRESEAHGRCGFARGACQFFPADYQPCLEAKVTCEPRGWWHVDGLDP